MIISLTILELQGVYEGLNSFIKVTEGKDFNKKDNIGLIFWANSCLSVINPYLEVIKKMNEKLYNMFSIPLDINHVEIENKIGAKKYSEFITIREKLYNEKIELNITKKDVSNFIGEIGGVTLLKLLPILNEGL